MAVSIPETYQHTTVMPAEVVFAIAPRADGVYVDLTAGGGGHSAAILEANSASRVIAFDRDMDAVKACRDRLRPFGTRARVVHSTFDEVKQFCEAEGIRKVDGLVADLGISSHQLADPERGMSFRAEGPLDMRMDVSRGETALSVIQRLNQDELANLIYQFGEERRSRRVARCIKQSLAAGELLTTLDLRRAVVRAVGPRRVGGIDPATRTFQALRIFVNSELDQLQRMLKLAEALLAPGAVAAIISFHSLEDRLVKRAFMDRDLWRRPRRKPILASASERAENPRSRSAKLRIAQRVVRDD